VAIATQQPDGAYNVKFFLLLNVTFAQTPWILFHVYILHYFLSGFVSRYVKTPSMYADIRSRTKYFGHVNRLFRHGQIVLSAAAQKCTDI
jgi:hypothetical protein